MVKVAISYRVLQAWRIPVFTRLAKEEGIELCVFHGESFENSKVVNFSGSVDFDTVALRTAKLKFKTSNGPVFLPLNLGLWSGLKAFDPDVIITEGASNAFNNLVSYIYARRFKKKIVQWGLGHIRRRTLSRSRKLMNALFFDFVERNSDAAVAYSSFGAEYYRKVGLTDERVYVAVNTVDTEARLEQAKAVAASLGREWPSEVPTKFNVLFVGALTADKNIDMLLRAFAEFGATHPYARLTIVGDGMFRPDLEKLTIDLGIEGTTTFTGHVSEDIARFFMDATVMVLPGLGGLAVSDALCHGVPVICGIGDGSEADLIDGSNGAILDPMDQQNLVESLKRLHADPVLQRTWRQQAPNIISEKYNINSYVDVLAQCVRDLTGQ